MFVYVYFTDYNKSCRNTDFVVSQDISSKPNNFNKDE